MRRYVPLLIAGSALIAAACGDSVSPVNEATELTRFDGSFTTSLRGPSEASEVVTTTFRLSPRGGRDVHAGIFTLDYDADAVCDPETSGYGPGYWRRRCDTLDRPITITATSWVEDGRAYTEFSPDVRFAPGKSVRLSIQRDDIAGEDLNRHELRDYNIWYVRRVGRVGMFIDEGAFDPMVRTRFDSETGTITRRIRHFSGWSVRSGAECELKVELQDEVVVTVCVPVKIEQER